jgi:hypothetical protein
MATSSKLENLAKIGQLKAEPPAQTEIDGLVSSGRKRLDDARNPANALESPEELVQALMTGQVPQKRRAHFQVLLDETPVALLRGLLDQVGEQATYKKVLENFLRIAGEQRGCRDLSTLLAPPTG